VPAASNISEESASVFPPSTSPSRGTPIPKAGGLRRLMNNRNVLGVLFMVPAAAILIFFLT